jgi:hypothetical protein
MRNLYSFLNIRESAKTEDIISAFNAYKKELTKFSPGVELSDSELRLRDEQKWDAYQALLDPKTRKLHDDALERDRIHALYESRSKESEIETGKKDNEKAGIIGAVLVVIILTSFFMFTGSEKNVFEKPVWHRHTIVNDVSVLLPSKIDTSVNIIPPFLLHYISKSSCYRSLLKDGFSVTIAQFDMTSNYKISQKDVSYIVNVEMSSHMTILDPDSVNYTINLHGYNMFVRKGTYSIEGTLRAFENYSMVNGTSAIKVIISYIPGNELHAKYAEIVFKSLMS